MNDITKEKVKETLLGVMGGIIDRRVITEPFDEADIYRRNPFGARLVPMEIWKGSKFERSFVTSLGQSIYEQLGRIIAEGSGATNVVNQHVEEFQINTFRNERINSILIGHRNNTARPDWNAEVEGIESLVHTDMTDVKTISDLFVERPNGSREYYSLKTVKPNLDQTEIAKRDMLRLKAFNTDYDTYFGLPFNPAGEGNDYRESRHTVPFKIFDMNTDESVLIGAELWNKIGDNPDTYEELLEIFEEVGRISSERIRREFLEI